MITRDDVSASCILFPPATHDEIHQEERALGHPLPGPYLDLVLLSNGLHTLGNLNILGVAGIAARNADYEVQDYLPGYFMIGDDGGGMAILLNLSDERIYEVDMGVMDEETMRLSADSIGHLVKMGTTLVERDGW